MNNGATYRRYAVSGLIIESGFDLPEWSGFEIAIDATAPQVRIRLKALHSGKEDTAESVIDRKDSAFSVPSTARYRMIEGREIVVTPFPGAKMAEIRLFLLGTAWAVLCYQRELFILHAAAVRINNGAVAFCGDSGAGKSSLAAQCADMGYPPVSDDLCRISLSVQGAPRVYPSTPRLKLWNDTLEAMGCSTDGLARDHFRLEKFHLPVKETGGRDALPLRAIYLLEWGEPDLSRLKGAIAVRALVRAATYRSELLEPLGRLAQHWDFSRELVCRVQIWKWSRPRDWQAREMTTDLLLRHFQELAQIPETPDTGITAGQAFAPFQDLE